MQWERYRIGDLNVDVGAASVIRAMPNRAVPDRADGRVDAGSHVDAGHVDAETLHLPRLSFDLLVALIRQAPNVVSPDELIAGVWPDTAVSDETLTQRVALLRRALGDEARDPTYIRSVRGRGYQLVPKVEKWAEVEAWAETSASDVGRPSWAGKTWRPLLVIALVCALALGGWLTYQRGQMGGDMGEDSALVTRPPDVSELLERAESYLQRQQESDNKIAVELFEKALVLEPDQPDALAGLSLALSHQVTKFNQSMALAERATQLARQAIDQHPRHPRAHQALGLALDSRSRITEALEAYARAYELDPRRTDALASAANLLQVQGHLAEALEANVRVLQSGDEPPYLEVQMGATLGLLGFDEAAEVWFQRALELRPSNVFAALGLARMQLSRGRLAAAAETAKIGLARGIRRSELRIIQGDVAWLRGDPEAARVAYEKAREMVSGWSRGAFRLMLLEVGAWHETQEKRRDVYLGHVAKIRKYRASGVQWPTPAIDEAGLHAAYGRWTEALVALDVAIDLGFRDADGLRHDPTLTGLCQQPAFLERIERIERLVATERQVVLEAEWLPPSLITAAP